MKYLDPIEYNETFLANHPELGGDDPDFHATLTLEKGICPWCGGDDMVDISTDFQPTYHQIEMLCCECNRRWIEQRILIYVFKKIDK